MNIISKFMVFYRVNLDDINYLFGKQSLNFNTNVNPNFLQVIISFLNSLLATVLFLKKYWYISSKEIKYDYGLKYLFFAGTYNQFECLKNVFNYMPYNEKILFTDNIKIMNMVPAQSNIIRLNNKDVCWGIVFIILKVLPYWLKNLNSNRKGLVLGGIGYMQCFFYCNYFYRMLNDYNPQLIIMSNDHSFSNRSLLYMSKSLNFKTVYLQHASVSNRFPPLEFNYAFLDGKIAFDIYKQTGVGRNQKNIKVFLTGSQKPRISRVFCRKDSNNLSHKNFHYQEENDNENHSIIIFGIAITRSDDINCAISFCEKILRHNNIHIIIRNHPSQSTFNIQKMCDELKNVTVEDSQKYNLQNFFNKIDLMIASNSSIHLEATLSGIPCYYKEFGKSVTSDYYGYLKNGLILPFPDLTNQNKNNIHDLLLFDKDRKDNSMKLYSNSYNTKWHGKEGCLVGQTLLELSSGYPITNFYLKYIDEKYNLYLYDLKHTFR
ncbi:hypothetical protein [Methanoplanus endosymbiosus]|uniref:Uncharacterized protein n=1 Tax=Methanoplanus endosymbiosus TaxID=33865 RepID=A0A9E7PLS0_9EURY|nr:hypothetical protein [Methanoplanus endosymbiosus]UUX92245.1 hypothetical protein L6E24_12975 [Methanoplanus endosymbiosus]